MRHLVVCSDGTTEADPAVEGAARIADAHGTLVLICVLPGSLIDRSLPPAQRGRERRAAVDAATRRLRDQAARLDVACEVHSVALFGDEVDDTLLLTDNLGADAVVIGRSSPAVERLLAESRVPVLVIPESEPSA
jgi:nucleotide-binding universal stress UspA family protein